MLKNQRRNKRAQAENIMENLKQRGLEVKRVCAKKIRKNKGRNSEAASERMSHFSDCSLPFINRRGKTKHVEFIINPPTEKTEEQSDQYSTEEMKISEMFQISLSKVMSKIKEVYGKDSCIQEFELDGNSFQQHSEDDKDFQAHRMHNTNPAEGISDWLELIGGVKDTPRQT